MNVKFHDGMFECSNGRRGQETGSAGERMVFPLRHGVRARRALLMSCVLLLVASCAPPEDGVHLGDDGSSGEPDAWTIPGALPDGPRFGNPQPILPRAGWTSPSLCASHTDNTFCDECYEHDGEPWSLGRNDAGDGFGTAMAVGDFNGDGYPDLAVGVPGADVNGEEDAGLVYIYLGTERGFEPWRTVANERGEMAGARWGTEVAAADLDDDGHADLVVALGAHDVDDQWLALYRGSATGLFFDQEIYLENIDPNGHAEPWSELGARMEFGDIDGDGWPDLVVGAPGQYVGADGLYTGAVYVVPNDGAGYLDDGYATRLTPSMLYVGPFLEPGGWDGMRFGAVLAVGEVTGAGDHDVVVAVGEDYSFQQPPGLYVYEGDMPLAWVENGLVDAFGTSLVVGDADMDGVDEVYVGGAQGELISVVHGFSGSGAYYVDVTGVPGEPMALSHVDRTSARELLVQGVEPYEDQYSAIMVASTGTTGLSLEEPFFGLSVPRAGDDSFGRGVLVADVDGDGRDDILVTDRRPDSAGLDSIFVFALPWGGDWFDPDFWLEQWELLGYEPDGYWPPYNDPIPVQQVTQETSTGECDRCDVFALPDGALCSESPLQACLGGVCSDFCLSQPDGEVCSEAPLQACFSGVCTDFCLSQPDGEVCNEAPLQACFAGACTDFCLSQPDGEVCNEAPLQACFAGECTDFCLSHPAGEGCVEFCLSQADGTLCGDGLGDELCVGGACVARGCGDGYREPAPGTPEWPREACDDGNTLDGDACSSVCDPERLVVSSLPYAESAPGRRTAAVAADDSGQLLFVYTEDVAGVRELRAKRYGVGGSLPVDGGAHELVLSANVGVGWDPQPSVAGLADGWVVVWTDPAVDGDGAGIAMQRVFADGSLGAVDAANVGVSGSQREGRVAASSGGWTVVWTDESGVHGPLGQSVVRARGFDSFGAERLAEVTLSDPALFASEPAIATSASGIALVAWTEAGADLDAPSYVVARRLTGASSEAAFLLSGAGGFEPAVAGMDTFVVAWVRRDSSHDYLGDIQARTVAEAGDPLFDSTVVTIVERGPMEPPRAETGPSVAWTSSTDYLVAYEDGGQRRGLAYGHVGMSALVPESAPLSEYLRHGFQGDVSLVQTTRGIWFVWSDARDDGPGDPAAYRSVLAYLLPLN